MDRGSQTPNATMTAAASGAGTTRVRFRERQVLRAEDLALEQSYLIAAGRRHNLSHHGWGIVQGLRISAVKGIATEPEITVEPGIAVDGYGRQLIVSAPLIIPQNAFTELESDLLDVWLLYDLVDVNVPQKGSWSCGPGQNTRTRERTLLRLTATPRLDPTIVPREPAEVPAADLPFPPARTPPDDPAREWPVYLGTINKATTAVDPRSPRPYAGLTGELVTAPSGRARMQVGQELKTDTRRFAISIAESGKFVERLAVDREADTVMTGQVRVSDLRPDALRLQVRADATNRQIERTTRQLRLRENKAPDSVESTQSNEPLCQTAAATDSGETPGAARMVNFLPLTNTPVAAAPWQIYRTTVQENKRNIQQLRIEIGHPGDKGDPKLSKLSVGTTNDAGNFVPRLTVSADCTVTVEGDVNVGGQLLEGPIQPNPTDPRFTAEIAAQWANGTIIGEMQAGTLFGGINSGELTINITDESGRDLPPEIAPSDVLRYGFSVSNETTNKITNILLYATINFDDDEQVKTFPDSSFDLAADETRLVPGSNLDPGAKEGTIRIAVVALGVAAVPSVVGTADSVTVLVKEEQIPG